MHEAKRGIKKRLEEMEGRDLKGAALEEFHILTDTYKNILKIEMMEDGGYSQRRGYSRDDEDHREMYPMDGGYSDKRDRYGRYTRDDGYSDRYEGGDSYRRGRYSRDDGMDHMKREFQRMMDEAKSPEEKRAIERCMRQLDD